MLQRRCWAAAPASGAPARVSDFDHVVVVFENKEAGNVLGNPDARTFNLYARVYARVTQ